jgi:hypothetical protein
MILWDHWPFQPFPRVSPGRIYSSHCPSRGQGRIYFGWGASSGLTAGRGVVCWYHDRYRAGGGRSMSDMRRRDFITLLDGRGSRTLRARDAITTAEGRPAL